MRKHYFTLRVIGYLILGASFHKQGMPLYYLVILALVMEVTLMINRWLDRYKVSQKTRDKVEGMLDDIDIKIED